jgi:hypothetical protein
MSKPGSAIQSAFGTQCLHLCTGDVPDAAGEEAQQLDGIVQQLRRQWQQATGNTPSTGALLGHSRLAVSQVVSVRVPQAASSAHQNARVAECHDIASGG